MITALIEPYQAIIALVVLAAVFGAFLTERFPPAVVALGGASTFLLLGFVGTADVLAVFSNSAPLTIAALFILTGAMIRTGVLDAAVARLLGLTTRLPAIRLPALLASSLVASAFLNNTPVVAMMLPVVQRLSKSLGLAPTKLLIPISYTAILGGTCTLIGTSTNLLVDGIARGAGMAAFSIFEITPIGLAAAAAGTLAMVLLGPALLPARQGAARLLAGRGETLYLSELAVRAGAAFVGRALGEVRQLSRPGIEVLALHRGGCGTTASRARSRRDALPGAKIRGGDRLLVLAPLAELLTLVHDRGFEVVRTNSAGAVNGGEPLDQEPLDPKDRVVVEAVLAPFGDATGRTLSALELERFGVGVLGLGRHGAHAGFGRQGFLGARELMQLRLRAADRLLLEGTPQGLAAAAEAADLIDISHPRARAYRRSKAPIVLIALAGVVGLSAFGLMPIEGLALLAVTAILALRCIDAEEAWQSIDGGLLVFIFAMLAMGTGLERTGAAQLIVSAIMPWLEGTSPLLALTVIYGLAVALTEIVTNNAVAVVLTPIAVALASSLGLEARPFVVAVMFGASASFATPIGYQTNTMVYAAADYRFADFLKIGLPMNIIVGAATCAAIALFMPWEG